MRVPVRADHHAAFSPARNLDRRNEGTKAGDQVPLVAPGLHPEQVVRQQVLQDLLPPGQLGKDVRRGKRDVEEEGKPCFGATAAQDLAYLHELVIVDPDQVRGLRGPFDSIGELTIHLLVKVPITGIEVAARLQIVEERPHNLIGEAFVEVALLLLGQE